MKNYNIPKLDEIAGKIVDMMPPLDEFFSLDDSIEPYSQKLHNVQAQPTHIKRQKPFLELVRRKIERIFNVKERENIKVLQNDSWGLEAGVMDHHGILNDPMLFGTNIVINYYRMFNRKDFGDIFTFGTGNVPLNDFFHRRGFMIDNQRVNIFKKEDKNKFVFNLPLHEFNFVDLLHKNHLWHHYSKQAQDFLVKAQEIIGNIDISGCRMLGDQIAKINYYLWPLIFEEKIRSNVSNLISLEYDDMVIDYLLHVLTNDKNSFIYKMLLDDQLRNRALVHFEGKTGAWDKIRNKGTHFFWYYNDENNQTRLQLKDGKLQSTDGAVNIDWKLEAIIQKLKERRLLPCMLLKFSLIIFYMGLKPFTGYGSTNYISVMQKDLMEFLGKEFEDEVERIKKIKVNNMTTVPVVLKKSKNSEIESYFAFDVMKDGGLTHDYLQRINTVPIRYFAGPRLNDIYDYAFSLYGKGEKSDIKITSEDCEPLFRKVFGN